MNYDQAPTNLNQAAFAHYLVVALLLCARQCLLVPQE